MKITIVGAGNVGSQAAFYSALKKLGDVVLIDVVEGMPQGKALDMLEAMPVAGSDISITGTNSYADTKGSDIVVITAGIARKPGMSRDDLIETNSNIMKAIIPEVIKHSPQSILIIVTNPLDAMVHQAYKLSGFPKERVMGMAGVLDSARFRTFIAMELDADPTTVEAMVLGGHGDLMVPVVGHCKVGGKPINTLLPKERIDAIVDRVRKGGAEIVGLLKTGSAFFAPGVSITEMCESILKDQKKTLPCSVLLEGEYGVNGFFVGVPAILGRNGVEKVVELDLTPEEKAAFDRSVEHVRELTSNL
jgi:malate dehydrogenase